MRLENWAMISNSGPYTAPEATTFQLHGNVYGHPSHKDGSEVTTSTIVGRDGEKVKTVNSTYELGDPEMQYEKLFNGAKQRLLDTLGK